MKRFIKTLALFPIILSAQMLNQVQIDENVSDFQIRLNSDKEVVLTYKRFWERGPSYDSASIYLMRLDSLANQVGEPWVLRDDSSHQYYSPELTVTTSQVSLKYVEVHAIDSVWQDDVKSQLFTNVLEPFENELILVGDGFSAWRTSQYPLSNGDYMTLWKNEYPGSYYAVLGQRSSRNNYLIGNYSTLYTVSPDDLSIPDIVDYSISSNSIVAQNFFIWTELEFYIPTFHDTSFLKIMPLNSSGYPLTNPHIIYESPDASFSLRNTYTQDDGSIIVSYRVEQYNSIGAVELSYHFEFLGAGDLSSVMQIVIPFSQELQLGNSFFPGVGPGVLLFRNAAADSLFIQRIYTSGEIVDELIYLSTNLAGEIRNPHMLLVDRTLTLVNTNNAGDLFASAYLLPELVANRQESGIRPTGATLLTAFPNPFNQSVKISAHNMEGPSAEIQIFNLLGQQVKGYFLPRMKAKAHSVFWDGNSDLGIPQESGVYLVRMQNFDTVVYTKILLLR